MKTGHRKKLHTHIDIDIVTDMKSYEETGSERGRQSAFKVRRCGMVIISADTEKDVDESGPH